MKTLTKQPLRNQGGTLGAVLFSALFLIIIGIGAMAMDMAHVQAVRTELQSAADAAAIAGAYDLTADPDNAESHALQIAGTNNADGRAVSNSSANTVVTALADTTGEPPVMQVDAQMQINHILAPIFGRTTDTLKVEAK